MNREAVKDALLAVLKGIDETELASETGWWETSTGAEFGARKLAELLTLVDSAFTFTEVGEQDEYRHTETGHLTWLDPDADNYSRFWKPTGRSRPIFTVQERKKPPEPKPEGS